MKPMTCALAAAAALWAAPAAAQTTLEIFYAWPNHDRFHVPLADAFMVENPDVEVTFRAAAPSYDEAVQTVIRQSYADQLPDIHFVGYHLIRQLVERDLVVPLEPFMEGVDMAALGYEDNVLALGRVGGVQYAIPLTMSTPVMYYNADLVAQAGGDPDAMPTDWDGIIDLANRIDALGEDIDGMYFNIGVDDWMTQTLVLNHGGSLMTPSESDIAFDEPEGQAAVALFRRFHAEGGQPPIENRAGRDQFLVGGIGMYFTSTAGIRRFDGAVGDTFTLRTAPLPLAVEDATMPTGGMAGVILSDDPEVQAAAWEYMLFGSGPVGQTIVVQNTGYMPTNRLALGEDFLGGFYAENPNWYISVSQLPRARPWFAWPGENGVEIGRVLNDNMTAIAQDQKTPDEALADMAREVRALLPGS